MLNSDSFTAALPASAAAAVVEGTEGDADVLLWELGPFIMFSLLLLDLLILVLAAAPAEALVKDTLC
jgi:hypothetical protein